MDVRALRDPLELLASAPDQLLFAIAAHPLFSFGIALLLAAAIVIARGRREATGVAQARGVEDAAAVSARYLPEYRALGLGALAVIVVFFVENLLTGYFMNLANVVEWWRYATPIFAAALAIVVVGALIVLRGSRPPEVPLPSPTRRGWASFSARSGLIGAGLALAGLVATTVWAGLMSSSDGAGRFIYIEMAVPNTDVGPVRPWFYGWSYGVPVLLCLVALAAVVWLVLRGNAVRPYIRPEGVHAENRARGAIAASVVGIASAGMLLALGGAFRFIGRSGGYGRLVMEGEDGSDRDYEMVWQGAQFAAMANWLAPVIEVAAFVLLLLVAARMLGARGRRQTSADSELAELVGLASGAPAGRVR